MSNQQEEKYIADIEAANAYIKQLEAELAVLRPLGEAVEKIERAGNKGIDILPADPAGWWTFDGNDPKECFPTFSAALIALAKEVDGE